EHPGDLLWSFRDPFEPERNVRLWEDRSGGVLGFVRVDPRAGDLRWYVRPGPRGDDAAKAPEHPGTRDTGVRTSVDRPELRTTEVVTTSPRTTEVVTTSPRDARDRPLEEELFEWGMERLGEAIRTGGEFGGAAPGRVRVPAREDNRERIAFLERLGFKREEAHMVELVLPLD